MRWIDGLQNIANVLTKQNAEKDTLRAFLRDGMMSSQQTEQNKQLKDKQREARQKRSQVKSEDITLRDQQKVERKQKIAAEVRDAGPSEDELTAKKHEGV